MNPRLTGILFLLAAALGAFVYFYELEGEQAREEAEAATKRLFASLDEELIESIALNTTDGVAVEIERVDGSWRISAPLDFPGDAFAIDGIASSLVSIQSESEIEEPRPAAVYGLDSAVSGVRFVAGGTERGLRIGNDAPVGSNLYVAVDDSDGVFIVASHRVGAFRKTFDDLREKRVSRFDRSAVQKIGLNWSGSDRNGSIEIEPADEGWKIVARIQGPADALTVDELLSTLSTLRATGFVDDPGPDAQMGFDPPAFEARIELDRDPSESGTAPQEGAAHVIRVALGAISADGQSQLVRAREKSLYEISVPDAGKFPTGLEAYRFRQLAKFSAFDAKRVELGFISEMGETVAVTATRGDDGWTSTPETFSDGKLASMVTELSSLRADSILADEMGSDELAQIGLDPPQASITVYGDDDTAPLADIRLGTSRATGVLAQIAGNATVYQLSPNFGDNVPINHAALNNRFLAPDPAPEVDALAP